MQRVFLSLMIVGLALMSLATQAATPKEAVGFWGTVTGTVKSAKPDGTSFVFTVAKAEPDESKSKIKDGGPMAGKELTLGTRMPKKDGKPAPHEADIAYIKSLKPGDTIKVKIFAVLSDPTVMRIQAPGEAITLEAKPK